MKKYKVKVIMSCIEEIYADNKKEAIELAQMKVFKERIKIKSGDLLLGYKIIK